MLNRTRGRRLGAVLITVAALVAAGCGSDANSDGNTAAGGAPPSPDWTTLQLVDVSGEEFSIAELSGKPVLVENFATWCSNCLRQLGDTQKAAAKAGSSAVFVALSVETDLDAATVAQYAKKHGFADIRFAVMTADFLDAMSDDYGIPALNPPSTPKIVVDGSGKPGKLVTGFEKPEEILAKLDAAA